MRSASTLVNQLWQSEMLQFRVPAHGQITSVSRATGRVDLPVVRPQLAVVQNDGIDGRVLARLL
jgi:hypothetical protein